MRRLLERHLNFDAVINSGWRNGGSGRNLLLCAMWSGAPCLSVFAVMKYSDQCSLREKVVLCFVFLLVHSSSYHLTSTIEKRRVGNTGCCSVPFQACAVQDPSQGVVPPTVGQSLHLSAHNQDLLCRHAQYPSPRRTQILPSWQSTLTITWALRDALHKTKYLGTQHRHVVRPLRSLVS